jgi:hypothetical protein
MELPPRLDSLVVKHGISLSLLNDEDRALLLALAASAFEPRRIYREREVNEVLTDWLAHAGSMLRIDHVELRRWLVDARFISRDGFGRAYVRSAEEARRAAVLLGSSDVAAMNRAIGAVRAEARQLRAEKRRAFEARPASPRDAAANQM